MCCSCSHQKSNDSGSWAYTSAIRVWQEPQHPEDLLNEPVMIVPATPSLTEAGVAKTQGMRTAARKSLIEARDDRALRVALLAQPRKAQDFRSKDLVAYWRN